MPNAFYALSFEKTGSIVGYCQLSKQDLSKAGAAAALLGQLVPGTDVELSLTVHSTTPLKKIKIKKSQLRLDEVTIAKPPPDGFLGQPYHFVLDLSSGNPGDGSTKTLLDTPVKPTAVELFAGAATDETTNPPKGVLRVKFASQVQSNTTYYAIIDDQDPIVTPVAVATDTIFFPFLSTVNTLHVVMFVSRGVKPFVDVVKAK